MAEKKKDETKEGDEHLNEISEERLSKVEELVSGYGQTLEKVAASLEVLQSTVQDSLYSPDHLDRVSGRDKETRVETKTEEPDYENFSSKQVVEHVVKEVNRLLQEAGVKMAEALSDQDARIQCLEAVGELASRDENSIYGQRRKEFYDHGKEMLTMFDKYQGMKAIEAFDFVMKGKSEEKSDEGEKGKEESTEKGAEGKRGINAAEVAKHIQASRGEKPTGRSKEELETRSFESNKEAAEGLFDEYFPGTGEAEATSE